MKGEHCFEYDGRPYKSRLTFDAKKTIEIKTGKTIGQLFFSIPSMGLRQDDLLTILIETIKAGEDIKNRKELEEIAKGIIEEQREMKLHTEIGAFFQHLFEIDEESKGAEKK